MKYSIGEQSLLRRTLYGGCRGRIVNKEIVNLLKPLSADGARRRESGIEIGRTTTLEQYN